MAFRYLLRLLAVAALLWESQATFLRQRRQVGESSSSPDLEKAYRPPIALSSAPVSASATLQQNSYQPPISLVSRSNEYQSPLIPYPADAPRTYNSHPQTYVLQNSPHQSVQYFPPQQSSSVFQQQPPATSYSVHQQPAQSTSFSHSTTAERTSKVVASHVPSQAIHKAPASEIQSPSKGHHQAAKEKDKANDEYVVYYYYYYDNDTAPNNLSLNFDDIPSLESYDHDKQPGNKEPEKSARTLAANINSLAAPVVTETGTSSQPRSVGDVYGRRPGHEDAAALLQAPKPVSNVFRYGSNEVPRFPVLPNFVVTEMATTTRPDLSTPDTLTTEPPATQPSPGNAQPDLKTGDEADDDLNSVLDHASDPKSVDNKAEEDPTTTTTTTTTTTETPTTTEEAATTTTTEKPRRRPSLGGGSRRRFNPSPSSSFGSGRNRQAPNRSAVSSTSSTSSTTTTTSAPPRRSFQGNRIRPRPPVGSNRPRPSSRTTNTEAHEPESAVASSSESPASPGTTAASRSRFTSAAPRRFQSSRSRTTSSTSTTSTTTRAPSSSVSRSRAAPSSRPRPNLISRNRPPRPGFLRPRPGSEPEEPDTTTTTAPATTEQEAPTSEEEDDEGTSTRHDDDENNETEEDEDETAVEEPAATTTEGSRFSALFRPRNRNALGNRPRPVIGNRPPRS